MRISDWSSDVCSSDLVALNLICHLCKLISVLNWRKPRDFLEYIPECFCIRIAHIKHDFGYILPCRFKELFGSFYPYPLYVGNGRVVGSLFKSPFKCSSPGIDQPGQRFDGYFLTIMFFNVILNFLDVIIPMVPLAFEYRE